MTRIIRELGPLAIVAVAVGAVTLWLLATNPGVGSWVLAVILFGHGWVHLMFLFPKPAPSETGKPATAWSFDLRAGWLAARAGSGSGALVAAGRVLAVVTFVLSGLAALATIGILVPVSWWQGLVVASSLASLAMLVVWFAPMLLLGILIDVALVSLAIAGPWSPA
jgi:hypothetical protein